MEVFFSKNYVHSDSSEILTVITTPSICYSNMANRKGEQKIHEKPEKMEYYTSVMRNTVKG